MKPRSITFASCIFLSILLSLTAAHAQFTWEGNTSNDWGTAANWNPVAVPAAGTDIVISDTTGSSSIMVLDADREVGSWTFGDAGTRTSYFTVRHADNTLTFNNGLVADGAQTGVGLAFFGNVTIAAAQTWSIGGDIGSHSADRGVFIREVRNASNSITGVGSLVLDGNLTKTNTGQLDLAATTVSGAGNFIIDEGALKLNAGSSRLLTIGGSGNVTLNNSAQLFVSQNSGSMDITRDIILNGTTGTVWGGGGSSTNSTVASAIAWNGTDHTLQIATSGNKYTSSGDWAGAATVNRTGAGSSVLTLTGDNSGFTGSLNLDAGTTSIDGAFGGDLIVNSGTANVSIATLGGDLDVGIGATLSGEVTAGGNLTLEDSTFSADPTSGASLGATGNLTLTGVSEVTLSQNPTSSSPFTVLTYGGTLTGGITNLDLVGGATEYRTPTFDDSTAGIITLSVDWESRTWDGGTTGDWDVNFATNWLEGDNLFYQLDDTVFGDNGGDTVISLYGTLRPSSITVDSSHDYEFDALTYGGLISGTTDLSKSGAGNLTIGGSNTFSGGITVNGGTLKPTGSQALGANGQVITIASGAMLDTNGKMSANRDYHAIISGSGIASAGVITNSGGNHNNGFGKITLAADATIGGTGRWDMRPISAGTAELDLGGYTLTKTGSNTIALVDGTIAQSGTIEIDQGTLAITRTDVSGTGSININSGGTLKFEGSTGTVDKAINLDGGILRNVTTTATVDSPITVTGATTFQTDRYLVLTGGITGTGSINKTGGYALALTSDANHTGGTTISAGNLQLGDNGTTGSIAGDITNNGALRFKRSDDFSFGEDISGTGYIDKEGTGTLTLTGSLTYEGKTDLDVGTLKIAGGNDTLPTGTTVEIANTAGVTFDLNGLNQEVQAITGGGTTGGSVINSGGSTSTLSIRPTGDRAFAGSINGDIRVEVLGSKTSPSGSSPRQRFDGADNTYTGGSLVDSATFRINKDAMLGTLPASFQADNITIQNNGTIMNSDSHTVIEANRGITIGTGGGGMVAGWYKSLTVNGVISGAAGNTLTIVGNNGTVYLAGDNTYAGDTLLPDGTSKLRIGTGGTSGTLGTGNVTNNGQLSFNRTDASSYAGVISGSGQVIVKDGALTLSGPNTYTGNTTVDGGSLSISQAYLADGSTVTLATGAMMDLNFAGRDTIDSLVLGGAVQGDGTYNATSHPAYFTGSGSLLIGSGSDFDLWATDNGYWTPGAPNTGPTDDFDGDGVINEDEYAFGLNPTDAASLNPIVQALDPATGIFRYTRRTPALSGWSYAIDTSTNLSTWIEDTGASESIIGTVDDVQTIEVTLSGGLLSNPKLFMRVWGTAPGL